MGDDADEVRITLRLPIALRDRLNLEARQSGRSMNGEIVHRLEKTLEDDGTLGDLWRKVEWLEGKVSQHDRELNSVLNDRS